MGLQQRGASSDVCSRLFTLLVAVMLLCHPAHCGSPVSTQSVASQETSASSSVASSKQPEKRGTVRLTGVPGITVSPAGGTLRYYSTNTPNTQQPGYTSQQYDNYSRTSSTSSSSSGTSSTASTPAYDYVKAYPTQPYTTPVQSTYQSQYVLPTPYPTQAIPYSSPSAMFFVLPHNHNGSPYGNYVIVPTPYQALHSPLQYYSSANNGLSSQSPVQRVAFAYVVPQLIPLKALQSVPNGNNGYSGPNSNGYYSNGNNKNRYPSDYSYSSGESGGYSSSPSSGGGYNPSSAEADYSRESYSSEGGSYHNRVRKPDPEELNDESRERESEESESVPSTMSSRYGGRGRSLEPYVKG